MANYYISDTHFGHENIMRHSNRKFSSVDEMNKTFIDNWNRIVTDEDDVWFLGDVTMKSAKSPETYLKQLNGKLHLIIGNHDGFLLKNPTFRVFFESIDQMKTITDNGQKIVLCHYPLAEWDGSFRGALHFYGHIHNNVNNDTYKIMKNIKNAYNVGTDILGYTPRKLKDVISWNKKFFKEN